MKLRLFLLTYAIGITGCSGQEENKTENHSLTNGAILAASCSGCHSDKNRFIPEISALNRTELSHSLMQFKYDRSGNSVMHRIMRGYSDTDIEAIADFLGAHNE